MDIFGNIQRLNAENIDYINNIEKEIKSVEAKVNEILDSRHMRMYEFLEERVNLVKEMFPREKITTAFLGAAVVIFSDTFARVIFAPIELPVGILMAALGAPFFLYLLRREI